MIVADTGAVLALLDADDRHHVTLRELFEKRPSAWLLPWAVLPEVDYLAHSQLGAGVAQAFLDDLAAGAFMVEWGNEADLDRAQELNRKYRALQLGLVDTVVMAIAERRQAEAIATLDLRHFGTVQLHRRLKLLPRDL
ncbi:MAG: PIN domain-containing protein [Deltaproteobacteria bacterium]|nr:PIN domain-containing protein [Deltaproteobacteria bacterium]